MGFNLGFKGLMYL